MTFRTKLMSTIVALCVLSFIGGICIANAQDQGTKIIGKAHIKKGTTLGGAIELAPGVMSEFLFTAFEDTTVYITEKVAPVPGTHSGGYLAQADGFPHRCPTHGKEPMGKGMIGIPNDQIKAEPDNIKIELF